MSVELSEKSPVTTVVAAGEPLKLEDPVAAPQRDERAPAKQDRPANSADEPLAALFAPEAASYPFVYSAGDRIDLGRMLECHYRDPSDRLGTWARAFVRGNRTDTLALLADLNAGVKSWISYQSRDTEGTQTPVETLNRRWGSCRDLTVLLIEAARCLGFGARVVTGYLYNPFSDNGDGAAIGAGTTHAWADIYLPGAGWIAYDPTNGTINGGNLIRVAVTRDISQAVPVSGSFVGAPGDYLGMTVDVAVISERRAEASSA